MTEPSERDREMAAEICVELLPHLTAVDNRRRIAEAIAAARAEERERCAKIAKRTARAMAEEDDICCAGVADNIATRIRSGQ